MIHVLFPNY